MDVTSIAEWGVYPGYTGIVRRMSGLEQIVCVVLITSVVAGSTISDTAAGYSDTPAMQNRSTTLNSTLPVNTIATNSAALDTHTGTDSPYTNASFTAPIPIESSPVTTSVNGSPGSTDTTDSPTTRTDTGTDTPPGVNTSVPVNDTLSLNTTTISGPELQDRTHTVETSAPTNYFNTTTLMGPAPNTSPAPNTHVTSETGTTTSMGDGPSIKKSATDIPTRPSTVQTSSPPPLQRSRSPGGQGSTQPMPTARRATQPMPTAHRATQPMPTARRGGRIDLRLVNVSSEQRLMADLLWNYENSVRPVYNSSRSVGVQLGLTLTQILDLDEKNQVLTTNVWLVVEWNDEKLRWDADKYEGTHSMRIPCRQIWLPDIVLYNSVDDYTSGYMPSLAMVEQDGRVFWGPVVRFRSSCKIDITYFPFDDQVCYLKLGSWAYNGFQVDATKRSDSIDLSNYIDNGEWELIGVKVTRNSVIYNCCKEPFPDVMFYMRLRRRVKYYFMNIIIPCIILSFLCLAGFLLPPESGEKITLGLSVLLTITVFMLMVADKMPQTSESISLISIYLMVVLSMSCMSILFSVGILSIHHQRGKPRRCPDLIKYFVFSIIAPILCLKLHSSGHVLKRNVVREKPSRPKRSFPEKPEIIHLDGRCDLNDFDEEFETFMTEQSLPDFDLDLKSFQEKQNSVNELIQWLHRKHKTETIEDLSFREWRDVAFVLDRLLFVLFLVVTVISTVAILSMRPEQVLTGFTDVHVNNYGTTFNNTA